MISKANDIYEAEMGATPTSAKAEADVVELITVQLLKAFSQGQNRFASSISQGGTTASFTPVEIITDEIRRKMEAIGDYPVESGFYYSEG
jgi:hypothetical protein